MKTIFAILFITAAPHFFCTLTSHNLICEPNNQVCVLEAINECCEALCDVHMYVCLCIKVSVNCGQSVWVFVFFKNRVCKSDFKDSKYIRTSKLHDWFKSYKSFDAVFFQIKSKSSNVGLWSFFSETGILRCVLKFNFGWLYLKLDSKTTISEPKNLYNFRYFLKCFWDQTSDILSKI